MSCHVTLIVTVTCDKHIHMSCSFHICQVYPCHRLKSAVALNDCAIDYLHKDHCTQAFGGNTLSKPHTGPYTSDTIRSPTLPTISSTFLGNRSTCCFPLMQAAHWVGACDSSMSRPFTRLLLFIVLMVHRLTWPRMQCYLSKVHASTAATNSFASLLAVPLHLIQYICPSFHPIPNMRPDFDWIQQQMTWMWVNVWDPWGTLY